LPRNLFVVATEREEVMMGVVTVAGSRVERDVDPPSVVRFKCRSWWRREFDQLLGDAGWAGGRLGLKLGQEFA
jgi:hypothetical protein